MSRRAKRFLPRPYQEKAVREVLTLYTKGARKMLLHRVFPANVRDQLTAG
jgi:hypothetical protein